MTVFRIDDDPESNTHRVIIQPIKRPDGIIVGRVLIAGPYGVLPLSDEDGNGGEFPILESFDIAANRVGPSGTVYVYDPYKLWAPEWPPLT